MSQYAGQFVAVRNQDELRQLIGLCAQEGTPLIPTSNGGMPPLMAGEENHCVVSVAEMDEVIAYEADDLTLTVGVGAKVGDIQRIVKQSGQRLAVEVRSGASTAVGSMVAMGASGFLSSALGSLADQVLGIEAIAGDGRRLVGGGRVVKNVTGYDFVRLLCGSAGSLGIITQVTFRLRPLPPTELSFVLEPGSLETCVELAHKLRESKHVVTAIVIVDGMAVHELKAGPLLMIRVEGSEESTAIFGEDLRKFGHPCHFIDPEDSQDFWEEIRLFPSTQHFHLCLRLLPSQASAAWEHLHERVKELPWGFIVDMQKAAVSLTLSSQHEISQLLQMLDAKELEESLGAVASMPDNLEDREARWDRFTHPHHGARKIGDRIKISFDPAGILLPRRPIAGSF